MGINQNTYKTHCNKGHKFTKENTYKFRGRRECCICRAIARRRQRAIKRGDSDLELVVSKALMEIQQRVPNGPLREAFLKAVDHGVSPTELARRVGLTRRGSNNPDVDWLRRSLGITPTRGKGNLTMLQTIRSDRGQALLNAIKDLTRCICDECGTVMLEQDTICGLCKMDKEENQVAA